MATVFLCIAAAGCPGSAPASQQSTKDHGGGDAGSDSVLDPAGKRHSNPSKIAHETGIATLSDGGTREGASGAGGSGGHRTGGTGGSDAKDAGAGDDSATTATDSGTVMQLPPDWPDIPSDPGARGPWPVGVRTVMLDLGTGQHIPVDVWYPARIGSDSGETAIDYDFIDWLPPETRAQLPSGEIPVAVPCHCFRDLPIDSDHGPFPISIAVHHAGAFRAASLSLMSHWASRGFVVVAADHPKLVLADVLADYSDGQCSGSGISADSKHSRDVPALLEALRNPSGDFAFLANHLDVTRIAISGNGDGGDYSAAASGEAGVRLIMQWDTPTAVAKRGDLAAVVFITGANDVNYSSIQTSVQTTARGLKPTLFVSVSNAGSLSITEICNARSPMGRNGMDLSQKYMLCGINFDLASAIFPCTSSQISQAQANLIFSYATTAALEEFLLGKDGSAWDGFKNEWGVVQQLR
jgi:hypothetical protein